MKQCRGQTSMFSAEASHNLVSRFPLPGSSEARKMTVTSGLKCSESYVRSDPLGYLVRTCLGSSIWHSTRCYLTWKTKDLPHNRLLFRLAVSMPRTKESECALWPTPSTGASLCGGTGNFRTLQRMKDRGLITETEFREMSKGNGGKVNPELIEWLMGYEQAFTKLIPTPTQTDYRGGGTEQILRGQKIRRASEEFGMQPPWENWIPEPELDRVADGIPNRVDRLKCLGNAVVPQQFYIFFRLMADIVGGDTQ